MDDVYTVLITIDYPEALTGGLRRASDALRGVLERTRGDVTNALVMARMQDAIERRVADAGPVTWLVPGGVAQSGRALRSQRRSRGFKSHHLHLLPASSRRRTVTRLAISLCALGFVTVTREPNGRPRATDP